MPRYQVDEADFAAAQAAQRAGLLAGLICPLHDDKRMYSLHAIGVTKGDMDKVANGDRAYTTVELEDLYV